MKLNISGTEYELSDNHFDKFNKILLHSKIDLLFIIVPSPFLGASKYALIASVLFHLLITS